MPQPEAVVATRGLRKVYTVLGSGAERIVAIEALDLEIPRGEIFGLIGPNGSGKTTLLRMLATLLAPTAGTVRLCGLDAEEKRDEVCRRIGFMPEAFQLYDDLKVWEYLDFYAAAYGIERASRRKTIDAVIELTDLGVRRDTFCAALSKGMRQRLLLAKSLLHDPELLILDEPTDGMDPQARIEFRNIMRTLGRMGKTVLISSHILSDLSFFCTSVGIMERGRMLVSGRVDAVRKALQMRTEVEVEFLVSGVDPVRVLIGIPELSEPRVASTGKLRFSFDGTPEERAQVLAKLVGSGVPVTQFVVRESGFEEILLKVGAIKVQ